MKNAILYDGTKWLLTSYNTKDTYNLFYSTDNGITWTGISQFLSITSTICNFISYADNTTQTINKISIDDSLFENLLVGANKNGISISNDKGYSWNPVVLNTTNTAYQIQWSIKYNGSTIDFK